MTKNVYLLASALLLSGITAHARHELLVVTGPGPSRPAVVRIDARSGNILERIPAAPESVQGIALDANGEIWLSGNTLGLGEISRLGTPTPALTHPAFTMPGNLKMGPDGQIYVISAASFNGTFRGQVLRFDSRTGAFAGGFVGPEEAGNTWTDLAFGPDGLLYVTDLTLGVMRFDPETGDFHGAFVPGGRSGPQSATALAFGPDGNLYVADRDTSSVMRFHGQSGRYIDHFVPTQSGGLKGPTSLAFGENQQLFVACPETHSILRFNGKTGAFTGTIVSANPQLGAPTRLISALP